MDAEEVYLAKPAPEAVAAHLREPVTATLGTINDDGSVHLAFVIFLFEDERFYVETASMTVKARNIAARPTVSIAIDGPGFMVAAEGSGRLLTGTAADDINRRLRAKYLTPAAATTVGESWGSVDDVTIEVTPTRWRSWSNAKFRELSSAGAGDLPASEWWVDPA
jgi:F420H(2)-dependent biliverdin reductase